MRKICKVSNTCLIGRACTKSEKSPKCIFKKLLMCKIGKLRKICEVKKAHKVGNMRKSHKIHKMHKKAQAL